jgi:hypothetical protein
MERSAVLFGAAAALREPIGSVIDQIDQEAYESRIAKIKGKMESAAFNSCWATGSAMTMEDALDYAMGS